MKWKKIIKWFLLVLMVASLVTIYVTRNQWMQYYLKREISIRTNGQASLDFQKIRLDVFKRRLVVYKPSVQFEGIYLDKKNGLLLQRSTFNQLQIHNLSLWKLFLYGEYYINSLTVSNPSFYLGTQDSLVELNNQESFDPLEIIHLLQTKRLPELPFRFHINHTQILNGVVQLLQKDDSSSYGSAKYTLSIDNLQSLAAREQNGLTPLQYGSLKLTIHDLNRFSKKDRFRFVVDSLHYLSQGHRLFIGGFHYESLPEKSQAKSPLRLRFNNITLTGMKTDTIEKNIFLHFHSLKADGGAISFQNSPRTHKNRMDPEILLNKFFKHYQAVELDSLAVHRLHWTVVNQAQDTLMSAHQAAIGIEDVRISEKDPKKILNHLEYSSMRVNMQKVTWKDDDGINSINTLRAQYSSAEKELKLENVYWKKKCSAGDADQFWAHVPEFSVQNLIVKNFLKNKPQRVWLRATDPNITIRLSKNCTKNRTFTEKEPELIIPEGIKLIQANLLFIGRQNDTLSIQGLNGYTNDFQSLISAPTTFQPDSLSLTASNSYYQNLNNKISFSSRALTWTPHILKAEQCRFQQEANNQSMTFMLPVIQLKKLNLPYLLQNHELEARDLLLRDPVIELHLSASTKSRSKLTFLKEINLAKLHIQDGKIDLSGETGKDSLHLQADFKLEFDHFQWTRDSGFHIAFRKNWNLGLSHTLFSYGDFKGQIGQLDAQSDSSSLSATGFNLTRTSQNLHLEIPKVDFSGIDYPLLLSENKVHFSKILLFGSSLQATLKKQKSGIEHFLKKWDVRFDSLQLSHADFKLSLPPASKPYLLEGSDLNTMYLPLSNTQLKKDSTQNVLSDWNITLKKLAVSDSLTHFQVIADQIALQAEKERLSIGLLSGSNKSSQTSTEAKKVVASFNLKDIQWDGLFMRADSLGSLHIKKWSVPSVWVHITNNGTEKNKAEKRSLSVSLLNKQNNLLNNIRIDTAMFDNVDILYSYDNAKKQVSLLNEKIQIGTIHIDTTLNSGENLFRQMIIDTRNKSIVSGDSLYIFHTKDIRINLPQKQITLDSITLLPRFNRNDFFARSKTQTDRISIYGKSVNIHNFDFPDLFYKKIFRAGNLSFDKFNILIERDKHYPIDTTTKPMPLQLLKEIPYNFKLDSVELSRSLVSYYEFEKKSLLPGIFFIDDFNVYFLDVSNDSSLLNSNSVLKISGKGNLMRETPLNFVLVTPYFAPHNQFWFSAQTQWADLSQFNSLMENIVGISIKKGMGRADVQYVSGNDETAKGNMLFEYKNLKLRLYNRKKAITNKSLGSPFVNFMLNNLMIRSRNPKFLKPPRKGIVYYERDPHKSFINYLWKSSLSGILSTLGYNNKQQRQEKKSMKQTERKTKKSAEKNEH